jgi:hypothetical protein
MRKPPHGSRRISEEGKSAAQLAVGSYAALRGFWLVDCGFAVESLLEEACLQLPAET